MYVDGASSVGRAPDTNVRVGCRFDSYQWPFLWGLVMACESCQHDFYDHGWNMPDVRVRRLIENGDEFDQCGEEFGYMHMGFL